MAVSERTLCSCPACIARWREIAALLRREDARPPVRPRPRRVVVRAHALAARGAR